MNLKLQLSHLIISVSLGYGMIYIEGLSTIIKNVFKISTEKWTIKK